MVKGSPQIEKYCDSSIRPLPFLSRSVKPKSAVCHFFPRCHQIVAYCQWTADDRWQRNAKYKTSIVAASQVIGKKCKSVRVKGRPHICHFFPQFLSTSVMWKFLIFLHMWRNFQFPHNRHTWKAEISSHDNLFSTNNISDISDKYEVWLKPLQWKANEWYKQCKQCQQCQQRE